MATTLTRLSFVLLLLTITFLYAYKDNYSETIIWIDNIQAGTDIETVKNQQPGFVKIAWEEPESLNHLVLYEVTKIKGNFSGSGKIHYLTFAGNKFKGCIHRPG